MQDFHLFSLSATPPSFRFYRASWPYQRYIDECEISIAPYVTDSRFSAEWGKVSLDVRNPFIQAIPLLLQLSAELFAELKDQLRDIFTYIGVDRNAYGHH
jgi:hypothetical protein